MPPPPCPHFFLPHGGARAKFCAKTVLDPPLSNCWLFFLFPFFPPSFAIKLKFDPFVVNPFLWLTINPPPLLFLRRKKNVCFWLPLFFSSRAILTHFSLQGFEHVPPLFLFFSFPFAVLRIVWGCFLGFLRNDMVSSGGQSLPSPFFFFQSHCFVLYSAMCPVFMLGGFFHLGPWTKVPAFFFLFFFLSLLERLVSLFLFCAVSGSSSPFFVG